MHVAKLIYSMITSLDGYTEAAEGDLGFNAEDEEVHTFVGDVFRPVGTYLYGRRMYDTMVFWETAHALPDAPPYIVQYAKDWQVAEKVVYSSTLDSVSSARTRIERTFDPDAVRKLKAESDHDLTVDGPQRWGRGPHRPGRRERHGRVVRHRGRPDHRDLRSP
jgi:dihydrofolate reductase